MGCCVSLHANNGKGITSCSPDLEAMSEWEVILDKIVCYETPPFTKYHDDEGRLRRGFGMHDVLVLELSSATSRSGGIIIDSEPLSPSSRGDDLMQERPQQQQRRKGKFLIKAEKVGKRGKTTTAAIVVKELLATANIPEKNCRVKFMLDVQGKRMNVGSLLAILKSNQSPDFNIFTSNCWTYAHHVTKDLLRACTDLPNIDVVEKKRLRKELSKVPCVLHPKQIIIGCSFASSCLPRCTSVLPIQ